MIKLVVLLLFVALVQSQSAGGRLIVSTQDMNDVIKLATPSLETYLLTTVIPDYKLTENIPLLGNVDITISQLKITKIDFGDLGVQTIPPNAIVGKTTTGTLSLTLNWSYRQQIWPHISGHGDASGSATNSLIQIAIAFTVVNGKPQVQAKEVTIQLQNTSLDIHGGKTAWIIALFDKLFKSEVRDLIQNGIRDTVNNMINNVANQAINAYNFILPVKSKDIPPSIDFELDIRLPADGIYIASNYLWASSVLTSNPVGRTIPQPGNVPLPTTPTVQDSTNFYLSDYVFNSMFGALQASNQLHYIVLPSQVPDWSPVKLNTSSFKLWLPELYAKFPDQGIRLDLNSASTPVMKTTPAGTQFMASIPILLSVLGTSEIPTKAFQIRLDLTGVFTNASFVGAPDGSYFNVTGAVTSVTSNVTLEESFMGPVDIAKFAIVIQVIMIQGQVRVLNNKLKAGMPVVISTFVPGLTVHKPQIYLQDGYTLVNANLVYVPPKQKVKKCKC